LTVSVVIGLGQSAVIVIAIGRGRKWVSQLGQAQGGVISVGCRLARGLGYCLKQIPGIEAVEGRQAACGSDRGESIAEVKGKHCGVGQPVSQAITVAVLVIALRGQV